MKFSISTAFYRRAHLVEEIYYQILNQTHTDWEWVVTDDFSPYGNAEEILFDICSKDPRVSYYRQSRKKECYWNPQRGCKGDIVIQFDSDDFAYPKLMEVYNHFFLNRPEVAGISSFSHTVDSGGNWVEIQGGGNYIPGETPTFNFTPMGRAWRNTVPEFDNGELQWYQQDTNIVRHTETQGKWLYLPRVLYRYYYSVDTISREPRSDEQNELVERERLLIEKKFRWLHNKDKTTASLHFLPIMRIARDFSLGDFNLAKSRQKIFYYKSDIKTYERQLLKELYFDHDLYFDLDVNEHPRYHEVVYHVDEYSIQNMEAIVNKLREQNTGVKLRFMLDSRESVTQDQLFDSLNAWIGPYGWFLGGHELYVNSML
jgi:glycosyltransferase involved in cell wall biosynthesis